MKKLKEEHKITQKEVQSFKEPVVECQHQFFKITDEIKTKEENLTRVPFRWGVKVMCVLCGQQRVLWTDGEVEIL